MKNQNRLSLLIIAALASYILFDSGEDAVDFPNSPPAAAVASPDYGAQPDAGLQMQQRAQQLRAALYLRALAVRAQQIQAQGYGGGSGNDGSYLRSMTHTNGKRSYVGGSGGTSYFVDKSGYSVMTTR